MRTKELKVNGEKQTCELACGGPGWKLYFADRGNSIVLTTSPKTQVSAVIPKGEVNYTTLMNYITIKYQPIEQARDIKEKARQLIAELI